MRPPFPDDEPRRFDDDEPSERRLAFSPAGLGMLLLLISLTIFFLAGLVGYVVIRTTNPNAPSLGELSFPVGLWASTLLLIGSGVTMHLAQRAATRGVPGHVRLFLLTTLVLALAFLVVQAPALSALLQQHYQWLDEQMAIYGLTVVLIGLHALHVIGGFVPLAWLNWRAFTPRGPALAPSSLKYLEAYWHFLHAVWILMFTVFVILG